MDWIDLAVYGVATLILAVIVHELLRLLITIRKRNKAIKALSQFGGPKPHWLYGTQKYYAGDFMKTRCEFSEKYRGRYVDYFGPLYVQLKLGLPDDIKAVYSIADNKDNMLFEVIRPWLGDGLVSAPVSKWARNRRLLTPAFHFEVLKLYQDAFTSSSDSLIEKLREATDTVNYTSLEIHEWLSRMTLETILKCICGVEKKEQVNMYLDSVSTLAHIAGYRVRNPLLHHDLVFALSSYGFKFRKALKVVHDFCTSIIKSKQKAKAEAKTPNTKPHRDFLDILLDVRDTDGAGLTDQEIQDEVNTFVFAGHETVATALSFFLYNMARHPDYQAKCRKEILEVLGNSNQVTWDMLPSFSYLTMCVKESLRLHPPVCGTNRLTNKEITFSDGKKVPAGTWIGVMIYACHHSPKVWQDPESYDPERFSLENSKGRHPYAFIPFAAGPRNCIGQHFAMNETKTCAAMFLKNFEFTVDETKIPALTSAVTLKAKAPGLFVKIKAIKA